MRRGDDSETDSEARNSTAHLKVIYYLGSGTERDHKYTWLKLLDNVYSLERWDWLWTCLKVKKVVWTHCLRMAKVQINLTKMWSYLFSAFSKYSRTHLNVWENLHISSGFDILPVKTLEICKWVMASKYALISGYSWDFIKCVFPPSVSLILDVQWSYYASILCSCELGL